MIYIKRILWLLGYPIIWLLSCILFIVATAFIGFECLYLYIKNGNIQGCDDCLWWCYKLIEWYDSIEPKEDGTYYYTEEIPFEQECVEYTRTDYVEKALIEKATSYIQQHWIWNTKMIEDFKNYMKGE